MLKGTKRLLRYAEPAERADQPWEKLPRVSKYAPWTGTHSIRCSDKSQENQGNIPMGGCFHQSRVNNISKSPERASLESKILVRGALWVKDRGQDVQPQDRQPRAREGRFDSGHARNAPAQGRFAGEALPLRSSRSAALRPKSRSKIADSSGLASRV